eukprot:5981971-Pleurochrysis_carterae.AAC.1
MGETPRYLQVTVSSRGDGNLGVELPSSSPASLKEMQASMQTVMSKKEASAVLRVLAAILHLGQVDFGYKNGSDGGGKSGGYGSGGSVWGAQGGGWCSGRGIGGSWEMERGLSSELNGDDGGDGEGEEETCVVASSKVHAEAAQRLFGCNGLVRALMWRSIAIGGDMGGDRLSLPRAPAEARRARDTLAQNCYARLFHWVVRKVNGALQEEVGKGDASGGGGGGDGDGHGGTAMRALAYCFTHMLTPPLDLHTRRTSFAPLPPLFPWERCQSLSP